MIIFGAADFAAPFVCLVRARVVIYYSVKYFSYRY